MSNHVRIFDTTLRDGEQSPGATMTSAQKLEVAKALARLGVDVIEAGFPAASPDDLAAVRAIAEEVGRAPNPPIICGLARANKADIDRAWEGVKSAARPRIHTFLATSDLHMKHKLRMSREEVHARVVEMVAYSKSLCDDVEFSPEDAGRTDVEFLYRVVDAAIVAGATTINIPDTVGYTTPDEFGALIEGILKNVPGAGGVVLSVHCHDDLGLATANSLAGIAAGARQAEVTINGIGERAGNTSLEEIVMTLHTRAAKFGLTTSIDTKQLTRVSRLVSNCTGISVQPNKAIVGANAFAHESGIHQDGMLKHAGTYEIMLPETVGALKTSLVLGKHSGRAALAARLSELGYTFEGDTLDRVFARFKTLADRRKQMTDADLEAIVQDDGTLSSSDAFGLEGLQVACGTTGLATATIRLMCPDGKTRVHAAVGTGPIDAVYNAIGAIVATPTTLLEFAVHAITEGIDALGEVTVRIREEGTLRAETAELGPRARVVSGYGADTDILVASAKAYLRALNRLFATTRDAARSWQPSEGTAEAAPVAAPTN